jgi:transposase InsO family protein
MNIHSRARLTPHSRAEMIRRVLHLHQPVGDVAAAFGISTRSVFKWLARFRSGGVAGLRDRSSRPRCSPNTTHPLRVARVLALGRRRLPGFQIARRARVSKATVSRLLRRHAARVAQLHPPPPPRRYERPHPGDLVHFDIKKLSRFSKPGHRLTGNPRDSDSGNGFEFLHIAIDDHSRLAFARLLPDESAASAVSFLHSSLAFFKQHGITVRRIYSDNGSCYRSGAMRHAVSSLGLVHRFTRPYTPRTNGKAERFIQTSLREWAYAHSYQSSNLRASRLLPFLHHYNWHRPHHSLNLRPPASRLRLPLNNLLSLHI